MRPRVSEVYLIIHFCACLLPGVLLALSFKPFARLSLPSLEDLSFGALTRVVILWPVYLRSCPPAPHSSFLAALHCSCSSPNFM